MAIVDRYSVSFFGTVEGLSGRRAEIQLFCEGKPLGFIEFVDPNMPFRDDSTSRGYIQMYLRSAMLGNVIDVLRNEEPVHFVMSAGRGILATENEPVGEEER